MAYTFATNLLSAQKTGSPNLIGTTLSGVAVTFLSGNNVTFLEQQIVVVSLSTNDVGIAYNPVTLTIGPTSLSTFNVSSYPISSVNVEGSVFLIPTALNGSNFAIVKTTTGDFTVFPWLSTTSVVPTSAITADRDVSTQNTRRLWLYGYM